MAINLLPVKQKRFAKTVYRTHRFIAILIIGDLLLLALIVLLFALNIAIKQEKTNNTVALATLNQKSPIIEFNQLRDEVNLVAKYADVAKANLASSTPFVGYLEEVVAMRSADISLTSLDFVVEAKGQKITLGGMAASRQNLLDFKSKLESLVWVESVDSPVTNLVGDTNSTFSLIIVLAKTTK